MLNVLFLLLAIPQTLALFDNVQAGSTGILIYDNNKLLVDFLLFFTLFMALSWISIRKFYGHQDQKGAAIGITISISLALAIGAMAAGLSASFSSPFIKYALFFLGTFLVYALITKLGKIESGWGRFAALLAAAVLLWLLFNVGNLMTWEGSLRPSGGGFLENTKFTVGRLFDVPTRGSNTDLMPFLKWIGCILAGILAYYLIVTIGKVENIWYKLLVVLVAILIAWLLCLAIGAFGEKKVGQEKGKSIWTKFTDWVTKIWPFGKGTTASPDKTPSAPEPAPVVESPPSPPTPPVQPAPVGESPAPAPSPTPQVESPSIPPPVPTPTQTKTQLPATKSSKLWYFNGIGIGILVLFGIYFFLRKRGGFSRKPSFKESVDIFRTNTSGAWLTFLQNLKDYFDLLRRIGGGKP